MNRIRVDPDRRTYLASDPIVDHDHPRVRAEALRLGGGDGREVAARCFEFVRDAIEHSFDHRRSPTTLSASEVLEARTGYCYAKSHLLVALLRANGLSAGFCYQRLTVAGALPPHCLHGYVAVELPGLGDYAIDARGNKPGVDASFQPPLERLAFPIQHPGEFDAPFIYPRPLAVVARCLREHPTWDAVLANLPDAESLGPDARLA